MTMGTQAKQHDDDMPGEIDFSKGVRGKFFKPERGSTHRCTSTPRYRTT
jgi:hypothetical protein